MVGGISQIILSLLGQILYPLFSIIFVIIDMLQSVFYGFAGISKVEVGYTFISGDELTSGENADTGNGIVYYMLRTPTLRNILISMVVLSLFLLIIFTVMAFLKNMYTAKQKKWQEIISSSIKGLINFIFIPVCCLLGVLAGNVLLRVLNEATANSEGTSIARQLFVASAYTGNIFRDTSAGSGFEQERAVVRLKSYYDRRDLDKSWMSQVNEEDGLTEEELNLCAQKLDEVYKAEWGPQIYVMSGFGLPSQFTADYRLWEINYLLLGAGGIFILFVLIKLSFGALKRLFMLMVLFVVSPLVCSLYPLDDGSAVGKWRGEFVKQFFSVYSAVIGMNLYFDLVPLINTIKFYQGGFADIMGIIPLLITIAGLYMISDFISLASSLIPGGGNTLSEGSSLASSVKSGWAKGVKTTTSVAGAFVLANRRQKAKDNFTYTDADGNVHTLGREKNPDGSLEDKNAFNARKQSAAYRAANKSSNSGKGFVGSLFSSMSDTLAGAAGTPKSEELRKMFGEAGRKELEKDYKNRQIEFNKEQAKEIEGKYREKKKVGDAFKIADEKSFTDNARDNAKAFSAMGDEIGEESFKMAKDKFIGGTDAANDIDYSTYKGQAVGLSKLGSLIDQLNAAIAKANGDIKTNNSNREIAIDSKRTDSVKAITGKYGDRITDTEKLKEYLDGKSSDLSFYDNSGMIQTTKKGVETVASARAREADAKSFAEHLARELARVKGEKDRINEEYDKKNKTASAEVQTLSAQALEYSKGIDTTGNDNLAKNLSALQGALQDAMTKSIDGATVNIGDKSPLKMSEDSIEGMTKAYAKAVKEGIKEVNTSIDKLSKILEKKNEGK